MGESKLTMGTRVVFSVTFYGEGYYNGNGTVIPTVFVTEMGELQEVYMRSCSAYKVGEENIRKVHNGD